MAATTTLLHLTSAGAQRWQRTRQGWQALPADTPIDPLNPLWVVTDLAEESFVDIEIPRLYGRDRGDLIERQLATRFPDTLYRTRLNLAHSPGLAERMAPTRHTLFGLGGADKIDALFDANTDSHTGADTLPIAALCPTSLLLTHLGRHKSLPADLFIILPSPQALRIVVLKNRLPVLTRLVTVAADAAQQAEEIIRTHRYLENTRVLVRGAPPPPTLILGDRTAYSAPLAAARFELIAPPPPWSSQPPADWRFPLFDLAVQKQPFGQLAPIRRRTVYFTQTLRRLAYRATLASLLTGAVAAGFNVDELFTHLNEKSQNQHTTEQMNQQLAELEQHSARFGVSHDFMQRALALQQNEITDAPAFDRQLRQIAHALDDPDTARNIRLSHLEWRLLPAGATACEKWRTSAAPDTPGSPQEAPAAEPSTTETTATPPSQAEIQFELLLGASSPRVRLETLRRLSARLHALDGIKLFNDPSTTLNKETLRGGAQADSSDKNPSVCLSLPGATPHKTEASPS
ncbi:MAG: hypothetical protein KBD60_01400 [Sterolibacterium sp.]|jgi:hypothetical protein|nr:hypothetical protein [Sterolibacterium sp.]